MTQPVLPSAAAEKRARFALATRFTVLLGIALGLASSSLLPAPFVEAWMAAFVLSVAALAWRTRLGTLTAIAGVALLVGATAGHARLAALDARALHGQPGSPIEDTGYLLAPPRQSTQGGFRFPVQLADGRVEVEAAGAPDASTGDRIYLSGTLEQPDDFDRQRLIPQGIAMTIQADKAEPVPGGRPGVVGALDVIRRHAEEALGEGTDPTAAALLRGFVLGEDESISEPVRDEFKRSGLTHILAVSGQNVVLLALLATPLLALLGVPLRMRFVLLIGLIAIYVPVAGGGPSIVRAGAMGIAALFAAMASRPSSRWYALALSAAVTLGIDPRYVSDVGWQLSFAAVLGILLLARPLIEVLTPAGRAGPLRKALVDGAALTIAATLTTAPLIALHFETVSLTTLPANLLAAPAVAPAMWLGMSAGALGQIPGAPVEPLSLLGGLCAGFIGWVAHIFGSVGAQRTVAAPGPALLVVLYTAAALAAALTVGALRRRRAATPALSAAISRLSARRSALVGAAVVAALGAAVVIRAGPSSGPTTRIPPLRVNFLDVGQGDSILLRTRDGRSMLVDTGPPGSPAQSRLAALGVGPLTAVAVTHDESDHAGGLASVLAGVGAERLIVSQGGTPAICANVACPSRTPVAAGDVVHIGRVSIRTLWPPALADPGELDPNADRNLRSLVLLVRFRRFRLLLTGDAEQGFAPVDPGHVDVLKVAHHGSEDPGLDQLLDEATPQLAVISVGAGNSYGHPTEPTLRELADHDVPVERTDQDGEVEIDVFSHGWRVG